MKILVAVAAHKAYPMPSDPAYLPVQAGAAGKEGIGFQRDDEGENISAKNPRYSELTALYWLWKNRDADALGLAHYRRHFGKKKKGDPLAGVWTGADFERELEKAPLILPEKRHYVVETLWRHYCHTLRPLPLELTGGILKEKFPAYAPEFERLKRRRSAHMFNMFVAKREVFDGYCAFLFAVLEELEKRVPEEEYADPFHARFFGRVSELLLDVYVLTEKIPYREAPLLYPEGEGKWKKARAMLAAKFFGKKYGKSF